MFPTREAWLNLIYIFFLAAWERVLQIYNGQSIYSI